MQTTKTNKVIIIAVVIIVLVGLYIVLDRSSKTNTQNGGVATTIDAFATSTTTTINGVTVTTPAGFTVEKVPVQSSTNVAPKMPDLTRPIVFGAGINLSNDIKEQVTTKILSLKQAVQKDPKDWASWVELGMYQKVAGNYAETLEDWTYASEIATNDFVSYGNIGNLYAYYLHDNGEAEVYYRKAVTAGPTQAYLYIQFAEMYRDVFHDTAKEKAIITEGLAKNPNDPSLLQFQSNIQS